MSVMETMLKSLGIDPKELQSQVQSFIGALQSIDAVQKTILSQQAEILDLLKGGKSDDGSNSASG